MADTLNDSLVKVTEELKEANERSLQASKELGKVTAASKASYSSIGEAVKEAVGIDKLKDAFMNLPGMNVAKAVKDVVFKKRQEKREQTNLAKRLGITRDQLLIQKAEQEVLLARESEGQKLIEAAEKLGFNTDRIAKVNEEGNVELNGSLRESNGQFVSKADASADANLRALKDFSSTEEQSQEKPEPKTKREDFTPVEETSLDKNTLEKLATENTLLAIADNILDAMKPTTDMNPMGPSGASLSEDAGEDRRAANASLAVAEETNRLLREDDGDKKDSDKEGGLFNGILAPFKSFKAGLLAIPAIFSSIVAGITTFAGILAPLALPIVAVVAGITAAIGFITGFMEGFAVGGIFGGLKEGLMKLFDWFIGLPLKILKDITVWALGALGMDGLADALDAFPLVESVRKIFSFLTDLIVVPLGFVMDTIGGLFGGLFDYVMAPIRALSTAIMSVFDGFSDIFSGIKMIFQGDILGGFNSMFSGIKTLIMAPINFVIDTVKGIFGGIFDMIMAPFNALFGAIGFLISGNYLNMNILENIIEAPVQVLGKDKQKSEDEAMEFLKLVGIEDKAKEYPAHLSGGQQQRAAIARALAISPEILLFDEPTSSLDPELVDEVLSVMRKLAEGGKTMLVVTHEMEFARKVSNKVIFLHNGLVEEEGHPDTVFTNPQSERCRNFLFNRRDY